jgi:uncharacterized ferritin-like protein (DUF455 family)
MSSYREFAQTILQGESLPEKYFDAPIEWDSWQSFELPKAPGRVGKLAFSDLQLKFPKAARFNEDDKKAMALHSFANHELLAIEMMAAAVLIYPHHNDEDVRFKKGIVTALKDEQKHLALYIGRLNELGYEFGDFPLNDFFWRQMEKLKTPAEYTAMMALTLEAANLDFAQYYASVFRTVGDEKSAAILDIVLEDEISHVAFGAHWMKRWRQDKKLWDYYREVLPGPITPARSRGLHYDPSIHAKAMNDDEFVAALTAFDDEFSITRRSFAP